jgi:hypothetical protein
MSKKKLQDYFIPPGQQEALQAYAAFATGSAWSVPHKMDLYAAAQKAFCTPSGAAPALEAFREIYNSLRGYWQVFRPHGAEGCWSVEKLFEMLTRELSDFSPVSGVTMLNITDYPKLKVCLLALQDLKPNTEYPTMAVSKFTHFFNPSLFPIYDTEIIWNRVFAVFKQDYVEFCEQTNRDRKACGADFLCNYIAWGQALMASGEPDVMSHFVTWLSQELPPRHFSSIEESSLQRLYATAFEFCAIGASQVESETV